MGQIEITIFRNAFCGPKAKIRNLQLQIRTAFVAILQIRTTFVAILQIRTKFVVILQIRTKFVAILQIRTKFVAILQSEQQGGKPRSMTT